LFKSFSSGHTWLWVVGLLTAFLTACYMFRLVFMTFHGHRQSHDEHHGHLHDAPLPMALALVVLAIGSIAAGWVGIGGRFETFLEPSFGAAAVLPEASPALATGSVEMPLMIVSVVVALAGIGLAAYFFLQDPP